MRPSARLCARPEALIAPLRAPAPRQTATWRQVAAARPRKRHSLAPRIHRPTIARRPTTTKHTQSDPGRACAAPSAPMAGRLNAHGKARAGRGAERAEIGREFREPNHKPRRQYSRDGAGDRAASHRRADEGESSGAVRPSTLASATPGELDICPYTTRAHTIASDSLPVTRTSQHNSGHHETHASRRARARLDCLHANGLHPRAYLLRDAGATWPRRIRQSTQAVD